MLNRVGRPNKFTDVDIYVDRINSYFEDCDTKLRPYTITGLALWLDTTRETMCDYEKNPLFSDATKTAKEIVANYAVEQCLTAKNPAGAIFLAKNHGFSDKQELTIDANITQIIHPVLLD